MDDEIDDETDDQGDEGDGFPLTFDRDRVLDFLRRLGSGEDLGRVGGDGMGSPSVSDLAMLAASSRRALVDKIVAAMADGKGEGQMPGLRMFVGMMVGGAIRYADVLVDAVADGSYDGVCDPVAQIRVGTFGELTPHSGVRGELPPFPGRRPGRDDDDDEVNDDDEAFDPFDHDSVG